MTFALASLELATRVLDACQARGFRLATAESCTGGLVAACLTEIPGSSSVIERGYVTYDYRAKQDMLGVPVDLLQSFGAVSRQVALAMAGGARERAGVDLAVAITGIAGPGGATPSKPVGLVHLGLARPSAPALHERHMFAGDRAAVRRASLDAALELILRGLA